MVDGNEKDKTHKGADLVLKELITLFLTFARIGGLTFGGGYAMLPMLQREIVERYHWATEEELADYYAIGQCTPGVIAVNTATFIGYRRRGVAGGVIATLGVAFPRWSLFRSSRPVCKILPSIRPCRMRLRASACAFAC